MAFGYFYNGRNIRFIMPKKRRKIIAKYINRLKSKPKKQVLNNSAISKVIILQKEMVFSFSEVDYESDFRNSKKTRKLPPKRRQA